MSVDYAEIKVTSNFSFLEGGSHPEELIETAATLNYHAMAITDRNSLAGVVRGFIATKELQSTSPLQYIVGTQIDITCEENLMFSILAYPRDRASYGALCRLLTLGKRRVGKGKCFLTLQDFLEQQHSFVTVLVPPILAHDPLRTRATEGAFWQACTKIKENSRDRNALSIALVHSYANAGVRHARIIQERAANLSLPLVATNDVYYHSPQRRALQDVLTCIKHGCTIEKAGFLLQQNSERHFKSPKEMVRLFSETPGAIRRTLEIAEQTSGFSLEQLRYEYPDEVCPPGHDPLSYLTELTWQGAQRRFPNEVPEKVRKTIEEELGLIHELNYEKYFLTCYDIVRFARERGILCQGRGAAANSTVCYCLEITAVNPEEIDLLFARFVSKERNEPPDIDIDFEHERREEVIQYIYDKYGREHAGITAEVISYRHRSAMREVAKVFGLGQEMANKLAKSLHRWTGCKISTEQIKELGVDPDSSAIKNTLQLSTELLGFPRHLSQHVGGFIISEKPLCESVPILNGAMEDRTFIEWDKDDIEALGMLKIDVLGLGMLTCIRKTIELVNARRQKEALEPISMHSIPTNDTEVYNMICDADTIGVFQIESRAQMSMLPRLKPRKFYDLVIEVAIVRPGPIQGNMVHPFLRRRNGEEKIFYPDAIVERILGKTLGVPIFQEQAMRLAITLAKFTPGQAEMLRRAMAAWKKSKAKLAEFSHKIVQGMRDSGYSQEFAERFIEQIKGFGEYGFPESHAASFALLAYSSAWLKRYYPAEFTASLINSQPMGFYAPSQLVRDAEQHGVPVLPIDINKSSWDCLIEEYQGSVALRLGMRLVKGLQGEQAERIVALRASGGTYASPLTIWKRVHASGKRLKRGTLQALATADAYRSMGLNVREALWEIKALPEPPGPLDYFNPEALAKKRSVAILPPQSLQQEMFHDYTATGLSLKAHPIQFIRKQLSQRGVYSAEMLGRYQEQLKGKLITTAGIAIFRQRPPTAKGVVFITIEDETGISNLLIKPHLFDSHEHTIVSSSLLLVQGIFQPIGKVRYIEAQSFNGLDEEFRKQGAVIQARSYSY